VAALVSWYGSKKIVFGVGFVPNAPGCSTLLVRPLDYDEMLRKFEAQRDKEFAAHGLRRALQNQGHQTLNSGPSTSFVDRSTVPFGKLVMNPRFANAGQF
jgi:hypothetical protein